MNATSGHGFGAQRCRRWGTAAITGLLASGALGLAPVQAQSTIDTPIIILPIADAEILIPSSVDPVIVSDAGTTVTWVPGAGLDVHMVGDRPGRR